MKWYYVENGQQAGPVEESQLAELVQSGKLRSDTLVWHEGMAAWQAFSTVKPAEIILPAAAGVGAAPSLGGDTEAVCAECGKIFRKDEMIRYKDVYVCGHCKPVFMQKLGEGVSFVRSGTANLSEQQILERDYVIDIGNSISQAWNAFQNNAGLAIGAVLLVGIVFFGCSMVGGGISIFIPFANYLISALYATPLTGGILYLFLRLVRGESATVGDAFAGFRSNYGQLVLYGLVQLLFNALCFLPLIIVAIGVGVASSFRTGSAPPDLAAGALVGIGITGLIAVCGTTYVGTIFTFSALLIVDKGYRFWPAMQLSRKMVGRRWWMTFFFLLVSGLLWFVGMMAFCVGLLVAVPIYFAMKAALYDENFRDLVPQR